MRQLSTHLKTSRWLPVILLLIAMVSIQSGASLAKNLFPIVGAPGVTALRLALATLMLVIVFKPWNLKVPGHQRFPLLCYGLALGGMNYLFYLSLQTIPLGIAVALEFTGPLAVALFGARKLLDFIWAALAIFGLWLLLPLSGNSGCIDPLGSLCALGAGACWALYIVSGRRAGCGQGPAVVALGSLIATAVFVPLGIAQTDPALWQWSVLPLGLAVALLSTAIPYSLEMVALTRLPARTFGTLMSMEPAIATLAGSLFLSEWLKSIQLSGLLLIITASVGSTLTLRRRIQIEELDK